MLYDLYKELKENFKNCITYDIYNPQTPKKVSCSENQKKVLFEIRQKEIGLAMVIDDNFSGRCNKKKSSCNNFNPLKKCDILLYFSNNSVKNVIFIELKGTDISEAIEQIKHSIKYFTKNYNKKTFNYKIGAVLIHGGGAPQQKFKDPELKQLIDLNPFFTQTNQGNINEYIRRS